MKAVVSRTFRLLQGFALPQGFSFMILLFVAGLMLFAPTDCYAGPGGEIIEFAFKTKIGRLLMVGVAIIFLPLIIWVVVAERRGISKTKKDLQQLSLSNPEFAWGVIEPQLRAIIDRLYATWSTGDLSSLQGMLAPFYLQSQQDILDRWKEEGKQNITELKKVRGLAPLHVIAGEQCLLRVKVQLALKDYLLQVSTGKVIKGSKRKVIHDHEAIWSLVYLDGAWQLFAIDEGSESLAYARADNEISPAYLSAGGVGAAAGASKAAALDSPEDDFAAEEEESVVEIETDKDR